MPRAATRCIAFPVEVGAISNVASLPLAFPLWERQVCMNNFSRGDSRRGGSPDIKYFLYQVLSWECLSIRRMLSKMRLTYKWWRQRPGQPRRDSRPVERWRTRPTRWHWYHSSDRETRSGNDTSRSRSNEPDSDLNASFSRCNGDNLDEEMFM